MKEKTGRVTARQTATPPRSRAEWQHRASTPGPDSGADHDFSRVRVHHEDAAAASAHFPSGKTSPGGDAEVAPQSEPAEGKTKPPKTVTVNITKLEGTTRNPDSDITVANGIYSALNIQIQKGKEVTLDEPTSKGLIGSDLVLDEYSSPSTPTTEEKALFKENQSADAVTMYFVKSLSQNSGGEAFWPATGTGLVGGVLSNATIDNSFAHELGHVLLDEGTHNVPEATYLMWGVDAATRKQFTPTQTTTIPASKYVK